MNCHMNKKSMVITASVIGGLTVLGVAAALICTCKKMKTLNAAKRTSRVMYHVGTAMRNLSCEADKL